MQFLFGMVVLEMVVQGTLFFVRAHVWAVKWILRTSWRAWLVAWRQVRIEMHRRNAASRNSFSTNKSRGAT